MTMQRPNFEEAPIVPKNSGTLAESAAREVPLCVDLDGTLIRSDVLVESLLALLKQNFFYLALIPLWLLQGRAHLKQQVANRVELNVSLLPYRDDVIEHLRGEHAKGRSIVLATASNGKFAEQIADHLGLFAKVLGSDPSRNLKGGKKGDALCQEFGAQGFDYMGDSRADLSVWSHARQALLVDPTDSLERKARAATNVVHVFRGPPPGLRTYLRAVRVHQWLKNILILVPLITAHELTNMVLLAQAVLAFFSFSLCASSVYLLNDLLDLPADRQHARKRHRPFASGSIPLQHGLALIPFLLAAALGLALLLPTQFLAVLGFYYCCTLAYSVRLKTTLLVDVLLLAGLYTLRIIAGAAAVSVPLSFWLLAFSMFLFLSLAMVKRYAELLGLKDLEEDSTVGRGYRSVDLSSLNSLGTSSGCMAVLVLALYINSDEVNVLYHNPEIIWLLCPLLLYWISRVWLVAGRGEMHDDPVLFAVKDQLSQWTAIAGVVILWFAI